MEILSIVGGLLFIVLWMVAVLLNVTQPAWYFKTFLPKLQKKQEEHPVISLTVLFILMVVMLYGSMSLIMK